MKGRRTRRSDGPARITNQAAATASLTRVLKAHSPLRSTQGGNVFPAWKYEISPYWSAHHPSPGTRWPVFQVPLLPKGRCRFTTPTSSLAAEWSALPGRFRAIVGEIFRRRVSSQASLRQIC